MKVVTFFLSLFLTIILIALAIEGGLKQFLPDSYRGYLIVDDQDNVKWPYGPYEPSQPSAGFQQPIPLQKPDGTIRIVVIGASQAEGWLTAATVFKKYHEQFESKSLSSYSRALEFNLHSIANSSSKNIEVVNLGIAAYNIADMSRMLKDSIKLDPDLFIIEIGSNEAWTSERQRWSSYIDGDLPYLYTELGYEIFIALRSGWRSLSGESNAFDPLALLAARPQPVFMEPSGRAPGLEQKLAQFKNELEQIGDFLQRQKIPVLFLLPSQNLADFEPFGSMAKPGTDQQQLEKLNSLLIAALAAPEIDQKAQFLEIQKIDDGLAEVNFQLGKIYLREQNVELAREYFWRANDRDLVLKRIPSAFHVVSRNFLKQYGFPYFDQHKFFESGSASGVVGHNRIDDDVHPNRRAQFDLSQKISEIIVSSAFLDAEDYSGDLQKLPTFDDYNRWTGFDQQAYGSIAYLNAAHNYNGFARFRQRLQWHPKPEVFLSPILDNLAIANEHAPSDSSLLFSGLLNLFLGHKQDAEQAFAALDCNVSSERAALINYLAVNSSQTGLGFTDPQFQEELRETLASKGCSK